ncbi:MAG: hypothetical protein M5U28_39425 [Sandaracinaceae bacterium]|nr:hypothetical protein [Sandaracinaceae bacterium]
MRNRCSPAAQSRPIRPDTDTHPGENLARRTAQRKAVSEELALHCVSYNDEGEDESEASVASMGR